jgi:hypothetical protein
MIIIQEDIMLNTTKHTEKDMPRRKRRNVRENDGSTGIDDQTIKTINEKGVDKVLKEIA